MGRSWLAAAATTGIGFEPSLLDEEHVRDQLSAAEELLFVGHVGPAAVATGAALEGAMRLSGGHLAGPAASPGALLEALLAKGGIDEGEYDLLYRSLSARDRLAHGYVPEPGHAVCGTEMAAVLVVAARLLERAAIA
ncbi:MAG: hypothetical protein QOC95_268 [Thermoleophilaceae bacterium]|jgi:hypothetical protein|nr:hypothetical protein [Thermoleophilaceae bacterium]